MSCIEPFLYKKIIKEKSDNILFETNTPQFEKIVLEIDKPHEGFSNAYYRILYVNNEYKLYYRASPAAHKTNESFCLATSIDGINFNKNNYNIVENNNKLRHDLFCHNFFPYYSEKEKCYLGISGTKASNNGLHLFKSEDGIYWNHIKLILEDKHLRPGWNHANHFDSFNSIVYNDDGYYYIFVRDNRYPSERPTSGRRVQYTKTKDFNTFLKCESIIINDNINNYPIYVFGCCHYPSSKYFLSLPTCVNEKFVNNKYDKANLVINTRLVGQLLVSNNCVEWDIITENIFGKDVDIFKCTNDYQVVGLVPSLQNDKLLFYISKNQNLDYHNVHCYSFPMNRINKIISNGNGFIKTHKIQLNSNIIFINFESILEDGYISVNIYDENNNLIIESDMHKGNYIRLPVIWKKEQILNNEYYYIEFNLYNSILYSFEYVSS